MRTLGWAKPAEGYAPGGACCTVPITNSMTLTRSVWRAIQPPGNLSSPADPWGLIPQQRDGDRGHRIDASSQRRLGDVYKRQSRPGGVHGAKPEHDSGNPVARQAEKTKVFAGHIWWIVGYMFRAERLNERRLDSRRQRTVIERYRDGSVENRDDRRPVVRDACGDSYTPRCVPDSIERSLPRLLAEVANCELHLHLVRDNVAPCACVDISDGHYGGIARVFLAAGDRLNLHDELRRHDYRAVSGIGARAVTAHPANGHVD